MVFFFRHFLKRRGPSLRAALLGLLWVLAACNQPSGNYTAPEPTAAPTTVPSHVAGVVRIDGAAKHGGIQVFVPGTQFVALTDDAGHFAFEGLAPGTYALSARADGFEPQAIGSVILTAANASQSLTTATLHARGGAPSQTSSTLARRGGGGALALGTLAGFVSPRYTSVTLSESPLPGATVPAPATNPFDGIHCLVQLKNTPYRTTCGGDGSFLLWNVPAGDYTVSVQCPGFDTLEMPVHIDGGSAPTVAPELKLNQQVTIGNRRLLGTVVLNNADGSPSNAFDRVTVTLSGGQPLIAHLAPDGAFAFDRLPARKYSISASAAGFSAAATPDVDLTDLPQMEIQLTMTGNAATTGAAVSAAAGGSLHGMALKNQDGMTDMSGITVALAGTGRVAVTDADGRYQITGIAPGSYQLIAQASGFKQAQVGPISVTAGDAEAPGLLLDPDKAYPVVLATRPADGAGNIAVQREIPIMIRFSKKMDPASVAASVRVAPNVAFRVFGGKELPDTDFDYFKLVLYGTGERPEAAFDTQYRITVGTEARDFEGLKLQKAYSMALRTGKAAIIGSTPEPGGILQQFDPGRPVVLYFNAVIDHATVGSDSVRVRGGGQTLAASVTLNDDVATGWTAMSIVTTLAPDTDYEVQVVKRPRTVGGSAVSNTPYTLKFKTAKRTPIQLPTTRGGGMR